MMFTSNIHSFQLPYFGSFSLADSSTMTTLFALQKPLAELIFHAKFVDRRLIISDRDVLIVGSDNVNVIYSNLDSVVHIQPLKLSKKFVDDDRDELLAFLPIGCDDQERFRSHYFPGEKIHVDEQISSSSLILFILRLSSNPSQLISHVFAVQRESIAFDLCEFLRRLIHQQTSMPCQRRSFFHQYENSTDFSPHRRIKYFERNQPTSVMEYRLPPAPVPRPTQVLMNSHYTSLPLLSNGQERHFIKTSALIKDESEEIVEDLMSIVAMEKVKTENQQYKVNNVLRPSMILNRYGDIGNYVPKLLRDNVTMRSSSSNENIFFRSSQGHLLNGFLQLDVSSANQTRSLIEEAKPRHAMQIQSMLPSSHVRTRSSQYIPKILSSKPKRIHSFNLTRSEIPVDYRQYLRRTGQSAYLYRERQSHHLESSLGYFP